MNLKIQAIQHVQDSEFLWKKMNKVILSTKRILRKPDIKRRSRRAPRSLMRRISPVGTAMTQTPWGNSLVFMWPNTGTFIRDFTDFHTAHILLKQQLQLICVCVCVRVTYVLVLWYCSYGATSIVVGHSWPWYRENRRVGNASKPTIRAPAIPKCFMLHLEICCEKKGVSKNRETPPKWMVYNGKPY